MGKQVLIIEDQSAVRLALRSMLRELGCDLLEADNPQKARRLLRQHRETLDLVILDLRLVAAHEEEGAESGLHVLQEDILPQVAYIKEGRLDLRPRVIVLTAYPNFLSCRAAFRAGAFDYIDKGAFKSWDLLKRAMSAALGQPLQAASRWLEENFEAVSLAYAGQIIAVKRDGVVAAASTPKKLTQKLSAQNVDREECLVVSVPKRQYDGGSKRSSSRCECG